MTGVPAPRIVLLVEDNPGDADLVREMMEAVEGDRYRFRVVHAGCLAEGIDTLGRDDVDVILLDLGLPDACGLDALTMIQTVSRTPVVVLTGRDDEELAMKCIDRGAQDYLSKSDIRTVSLRRSINYAINRSQELQIRELRDALDRYREIWSAAPDSSISAPVSQSVREREPHVFAAWVDAYSDLLRKHFDRLVVRGHKPREEMAHIVSQLGDHDAGPRDLVDIHVAALSCAVENGNSVKARTMAVEGRLVALEMMGLLVDYYRVRKGAGIR